MKNKTFSLLILLFSFSFIFNIAYADMSPKTSIEIEMTFEGQTISDESFESELLGCSRETRDGITPWINGKLATVNIYDSEKDCYWQPIQAFGGCHNSNCHFSYYNLPKEFKLAIYLPSQDKIYISNTANKNDFRATYKANILSDGRIDVQETTSFLIGDTMRKIVPFFIALLVTLILELLVALIYVSVKKLPKKILKSVLLVNFITLPIVWFIFPLYEYPMMAILLAEIFAFIFEGFFLYLLNKKHLSLRKAFVLSILMNLLSLAVGFIPFTMLTSWLGYF